MELSAAGLAKHTPPSKDTKDIRQVLKEGFVCHVAYIDPTSTPNRPLAVPMVYGYKEGKDPELGTLYVHGAKDHPKYPNPSRLHVLASRSGKEGVPVCLTVTLLDSLIIGRSPYHNSVGYRSVVVKGTAYAIEEKEVCDALKTLVDHVVPGSWETARKPNEYEVEGDSKNPDKYPGTVVLRLGLDTPAEVTFKARTGGPKSEEKVDVDSDYWAGTLPITEVYGPPSPASNLKSGIKTPDYLTKYSRKG
ncbi:pyridoxamine 5'-phosphate oxidase family protein [Kitasatospora sp. NPDC088548]|uniref:pyridoxamine 5'-phosphate oxidase family protein n=1 Tax=Kitasatospora sp. NPDC088548 TaxID=3364075 RepID=UPI0038114878